MKNYTLILTCEHAVNTIPEEFKQYFKGEEALLKSHRGYDLGALEIIKTLAATLSHDFFQAKVSRLLIDNNRSLHHPKCFSSITHPLPKKLKESIIKHYYTPYRSSIINKIEESIKNNKTILHLSIHSFTPLFKGKERHGDLCLLYDPARPLELDLATKWQTWLKKQAPDLMVRKNYPYIGKSDGLASYCRKQFSAQDYIGFEIESNQAKVMQPKYQKQFAELLANMLQA
ncbi:MAG: hypothetical protein A3F18_00620 [Legionellales bacterium RIFCSPHIGHO2_12_FULL_37_14]|nr:MAG: hypothetical protein A3F18_00620 [Legionellales bacterium RIFCSPHIGHO2_12_FULL_37_14]